MDKTRLSIVKIDEKSQQEQLLDNKKSKSLDPSINQPEKSNNYKKKWWETKENKKKQAKTSSRDERVNNQPLAKTPKSTLSKTTATQFDNKDHLI
jgi:hypothetical protein